MKKVVGYLIVGFIGFVAGGATGWFVRKKTTEVAFEEISEEEQAKQIAEDIEGEDPIKRPVDIQEAINRAFGLPDNYKGEDHEEDNKSNIVSINQLDTNKEGYFKKWKAEEKAAEKYDTRTKEEPKHGSD